MPVDVSYTMCPAGPHNVLSVGTLSYFHWAPGTLSCSYLYWCTSVCAVTTQAMENYDSIKSPRKNYGPLLWISMFVFAFLYVVDVVVHVLFHFAQKVTTCRLASPHSVRSRVLLLLRSGRYAVFSILSCYAFLDQPGGIQESVLEVRITAPLLLGVPMSNYDPNRACTPFTHVDVCLLIFPIPCSTQNFPTGDGEVFWQIVGLLCVGQVFLTYPLVFVVPRQLIEEEFSAFFGVNDDPTWKVRGVPGRECNRECGVHVFLAPSRHFVNHLF